MSLGFSSKRNLKSLFGKFGLGAKAALSTGVDFFTMHTVYNGYKTSFMIFKTDYEPITPKSESTIEDIWDVKMVNGATTKRSIFWEPETSLNSVEIELEVKAHNIDIYRNAVIDQFQHFNGKVQFDFMMFKYGVWHNDMLNLKPLYESENILIPVSSSYYTPIILIDNISYGPINWGELEMEDRRGALAIKTTGSEIDITPNRESVKYTERTKQVILKAIADTEEEATIYLEDKMPKIDSSDIFALVDNSKEINKEQDSTMKSFAKFLNLTNLKLKYTFKEEWFGNKKLTAKVNQELFDALFYNYKLRRVTISLKATKAVTNLTKIESFNDLVNSKFILAFTYCSIYIRSNNNTRMTTTVNKKDYHPSEFRHYARELLLRKCDIYLDEYEYVDDFEGELDGGETKLDVISLAKLRRLNSEILYRYYGGYATLQSCTLKIASLKDHFAYYDNVVICTQEYSKWGKYVERLYADLDDSIHMIYVAKNVVRDFLPYGTFITEHLRNFNPKTGVLTISPTLYFSNTIRKVSEMIDKHEYSWNYNLATEMNPKLEKLWDYVSEINKNNHLNSDYGMSGIITEFLDNLNKIQAVLKSDESDTKKRITSRAVFGAEVTYIDAYDIEFVSELEKTLIKLGPLVDLYPALKPNYDKKSIKLLNILINTLNETEQL